jgi:hypothetical protein
MKKYLAAFLGTLAAGSAHADPPAAKPLPVPLTRPEMKQALEDLKGRTPRFELPPPTQEEIANAGERGLSYEGRLRSVYIGGGENRGRGGAGFGRENEPGMTLTYAFKTQLFWIVSRTNNCLY